METTALDQHHYRGGRRDDLGHRRHIENGIRGHRLDTRLDGAVTEGFSVRDAVTVADDDHGAWRVSCRDALADDSINETEAFGRKPGDRGSWPRRLRQGRSPARRGNRGQRADTEKGATNAADHPGNSPGSGLYWPFPEQSYVRFSSRLSSSR